jgi:hypothetical protein
VNVVGRSCMDAQTPIVPLPPPQLKPKKPRGWALPRGRQPGRKNRNPGAVRPGARHDLVALGDSTGAARFFRTMVKNVEADLGGRRDLSRIEAELIRAFCGAATQLQYLNLQLALGEAAEIDFTAYATLASTRIGSRLGLSRRQRDATPTLNQYLTALRSQEPEDAEILDNDGNDAG